MSCSVLRLMYSQFFCQQRTFRTSALNFLDLKRKPGDFLRGPSAFGPLTTLPDYSFVDGRPTPLGMGVGKRLKKQREYAAKIIKLSREMDFAVERHKKMQVEKEETITQIIKRKFVSKGEKTLE